VHFVACVWAVAAAAPAAVVVVCVWGGVKLKVRLGPEKVEEEKDLQQKLGAE
jgi:hypothetical protein